MCKISESVVVIAIDGHLEASSSLAETCELDEEGMVVVVVVHEED